MFTGQRRAFYSDRVPHLSLSMCAASVAKRVTSALRRGLLLDCMLFGFAALCPIARAQAPQAAASPATSGAIPAVVPLSSPAAEARTPPAVANYFVELLTVPTSSPNALKPQKISLTAKCPHGNAKATCSYVTAADTITVTATSDAKLPVTVAAKGGTVTPGVALGQYDLKPASTGTLEITASQAGNGKSIAAAPDVILKLEVFGRARARMRRTGRTGPNIRTDRKSGASSARSARQPDALPIEDARPEHDRRIREQAAAAHGSFSRGLAQGRAADRCLTAVTRDTRHEGSHDVGRTPHSALRVLRRRCRQPLEAAARQVRRDQPEQQPRSDHTQGRLYLC